MVPRGPGGPGGMPGGRQVVTLTQEEHNQCAAIARNTGVTEEQAIRIFLRANRNAEVAASLIFEMTGSGLGGPPGPAANQPSSGANANSGANAVQANANANSESMEVEDSNENNASNNNGDSNENNGPSAPDSGANSGDTS